MESEKKQQPPKPQPMDLQQKLKEKLPKKRTKDTDAIALSKLIFLGVSCILSFLFLAISTGLDSWSILKDETTGFKLANNGLWRGCIYNGQMYSCSSWGDVIDLPNWWIACQVCTIIACFISAVSVAITGLCIYSDNVYPRIVCFVTVPTVLFMMIALSAYADNVFKDNIIEILQDGQLSFGLGFIMGWLGVVISIGNAVYSLYV